MQDKSCLSIAALPDAQGADCLAGPQTHTATDGDDDDDDGQAKTADLRLLAHSLVGFAAQQNLRLDSFAMGPASRALGKVTTLFGFLST